MGEFEYTNGKALLTAGVLTLGSSLIFAINSSGALNPNWEGFGFYVVQSLWILSFVTIVFVGLNNKIRKNK